eukprot:9402021-Pyramimonas_sp.AAC.1
MTSLPSASRVACRVTGLTCGLGLLTRGAGDCARGRQSVSRRQRTTANNGIQRDAARRGE